MPDPLAYSTQELANATPFSVKYIHRCIHSAGGPGNPPALKAKRGPRGFIITAVEAQRWLEAHEDA